MGGVFHQRGIMARECFVNVAEFETGVAEIVEDLWMIRRNPKRVAIARDGFLESPRRMKRESKIGQPVRRAGIDFERLRQEAQRLDQATAMQVEKAEQMERIEIVAPVFQNRGTQPFGLVEMA